MIKFPKAEEKKHGKSLPMTVYTSHCVPNGQFAAMEFILTAESANFEKAEKVKHWALAQKQRTVKILKSVGPISTLL